METLNSSNYKIPVSIFEATDRVIKYQQDSNAAVQEKGASVVYQNDSDSNDGKENKVNVLYRFLF